MSAKTLEELVGRQLVFGLPGPDLTDADIQLFEDTKAGGAIKKHVESIRCEAKYSNFRRFEAYGQIK